MQIINTGAAKAELRPFVQGLTVVAGLVTGLFWVSTFAITAARGTEWTDRLFVDAPDFFGAVLFFWIITVLPALVIGALHILLVRLISHRLSGFYLRIASTALALAAWATPFAQRGLFNDLLAWGPPLALLLGLYGWVAGGLVITGRAASLLDRVVQRVSLVLVILLGGSFLAILAYEWIEALTA